jgi:uncharacterized circularly permuted ATP-grasp superfamily protein/uncharacterized alpha-E superfamily protein
VTYRPTPGAFDEFIAPDGSVRHHWRTLAHYLKNTPQAELQSHQATVARLLSDHGDSYNVFNSESGDQRAWSLDVIPFLLPNSEFRWLCQALNQRAELLDLILHDLYGPQNLLKDHIIPPALIHANPGFIRPVTGIAPPGNRFLGIYGCDLARQPNGNWTVLADRTQSPSAHGYCLENRTILNTIFREEFHTAHVHRLSPYFEMMQNSLRNLSPALRRGDAGILMLTPGPHHESYFEQAFKARYLGFPLAESADLTVRDRRLWLKTLEGLKRVDVLLRHIDDNQIDPLELKQDTLLGIPGLIEAWRSGSVTLVNGIGTGLLETPAFFPYLPKICRYLLNQDLQIMSAPTLWCGEPEALKQVLNAPEEWVLKNAFLSPQNDPVFMHQLGTDQRQQQLTDIRQSPHLWVAQKRIPLSTTPTTTENGIQPRQLVLRMLATASPGSSYQFMAGGLSRVSSSPTEWRITTANGGISKDTWVVSDQPLQQQFQSLTNSPANSNQTLRPARPPSAVPSRAADHLYWLGRYTERLEQSVRLLRTSLQRITSEGITTLSSEARALCHLLGKTRHLPCQLHPNQPTHGQISSNQQALRQIFSDLTRPGSLPDLIRRIRQNAASARDRLSDDTWRLIQRIEQDAIPTHEWINPPQAMQILDTLILDLAAFSGMHLENVTRGHGWRFLEIGRRLERAISYSTILNAAVPLAIQGEPILPPLLEIFDSSVTYRRLHFSTPSLLPAIDLLLLDPSNPRSIAFQIRNLAALIAQLPTGHNAEHDNSERRLIDTLMSHLGSIQLEKLSSNQTQLPFQLQTIFQTLLELLESLSDAITANFFSHAKRSVR